MTFDDFVGQDPIKNELKNMAARLDVNILLRGPSGCGKTTLAELTASVRGSYDLTMGDKVKDASFNPEAVTHIIDEAHLIPNPEVIYDLMTSCPFIFCTTETGELNPTLLNRCIQLTLQPYTLVEMMMIGRAVYGYPANVLALLANRARETPRTMQQLCKRVEINVPNREDYFAVKEFLYSVGIFEDGYTRDDVQYLSTLAQVGRASAATMAAMLNLPLSTVVNEIEPFLLRKRAIRITARGRVLNQ